MPLYLIRLVQTTVVDFTVTQKGLEEQLLGGVIQKEQKSLEEQLNNVLEEVRGVHERLDIYHFPESRKKITL